MQKAGCHNFIAAILRSYYHFTKPSIALTHSNLKTIQNMVFLRINGIVYFPYYHMQT